VAAGDGRELRGVGLVRVRCVVKMHMPSVLDERVRILGNCQVERVLWVPVQTGAPATIPAL